MVLSSWPWSLWEFTRFIWWMQTERWVAANPQTKPTNLACESADKWLLPSTSTIAICYYYSARKLTLISPSHGGCVLVTEQLARDRQHKRQTSSLFLRSQQLRMSDNCFTDSVTAQCVIDFSQYRYCNVTLSRKLSQARHNKTSANEYVL